MEGEDTNADAIRQSNALVQADDDERNSKNEEALKKFKAVIEFVEASEATPASSRNKFHALERIVIVSLKLACLSSPETAQALRQEMIENYKRLLGALETVPQNDGANAINNVQKEVSHRDPNDAKFIYELTLSTLEPAPDDTRSSVRVSTMIKLATLFVEKEMALKIRGVRGLKNQTGSAEGSSSSPPSEEGGDRAEARKIITSLYGKCACDPLGAPVSGTSDDNSLKSMRLQIYAVDIQLCQVVGNLIRLKSIHQRAHDVLAESILLPAYNSAIIKEAGGRIKMYERKWDEANQAFFEAFKKYQETSAGRAAKACLKYAVVSNMLSGSIINPFDSCEAKALLDDEEIVLFGKLRSLVDSRDIAGILQLMDSPAFLLDEVLAPLLDDVMSRVRCDEILRQIQPYKRVSLQFVARMVELDDTNEATVLLSKMILQGRLMGVIDQTTGFLILDGCKAEQDVLKGSTVRTELTEPMERENFGQRLMFRDEALMVQDRGGFVDCLDPNALTAIDWWRSIVSK
eukprot:Selendium_serpulae@DN3969_c0_g1_i1.p1